MLITGTGSATIIDSLANFTGSLVGSTVEIVGGDGIGQRRTIVANTSTSFTVGRFFSEPVSAGTAYWIQRYDRLQTRAVAVTVEDDDTAGVAVVISGTDTRVTELTSVTTFAAHPGAVDTYQVVLTRQPLSDVTVTIRTDGQTLLRLQGVGSYVQELTLTFTSGDWATPRIIQVIAADDFAIEGPQIQIIDHSTNTVPTSSSENDSTATRIDTVVAPVGRRRSGHGPARRAAADRRPDHGRRQRPAAHVHAAVGSSPVGTTS